MVSYKISINCTFQTRVWMSGWLAPWKWQCPLHQLTAWCDPARSQPGRKVQIYTFWMQSTDKIFPRSLDFRIFKFLKARPAPHLFPYVISHVSSLVFVVDCTADLPSTPTATVQLLLELLLLLRPPPQLMYSCTPGTLATHRPAGRCPRNRKQLGTSWTSCLKANQLKEGKSGVGRFV